MQSLYRQAVSIHKCALNEPPPGAQELLTVTLLTKQLQSIFDAMDILKVADLSPETAAAKVAAAIPAKRSPATSRSRKA